MLMNTNVVINGYVHKLNAKEMKDSNERTTRGIRWMTLT